MKAALATVHCTDMNTIIGTQHLPIGYRDAHPVGAGKMHKRDKKRRDDRERQQDIGNGDLIERDERHPDQLSNAAPTAMVSATNQLSQPNRNSRFWSWLSRLVPGRNLRQCFRTICTEPLAQRAR